MVLPEPGGPMRRKDCGRRGRKSVEDFMSGYELLVFALSGSERVE